MNLNKLLLRQINKYLGGIENLSAQHQQLFDAISQSYDHYEKDHKLLERTIDLNSHEMITLNQELREETQKLKQVHHELATLFENIDETFFSVDMKACKVLQISKACERIYGYKQEDFLTNPDLWQELIHPDDREIVNSQLEDLYKGKKVLNQYRIIHKDGDIRWIENRIIPTLNQAGELERLDGITNEITQRKKSEELLMESEKRYKLVFDNPLVGVTIRSKEGYVLNANEAFCRLLGYTENEIVNEHFSKFTHAPDLEKELQLFNDVLSGKIATYQIEKRYITKQLKIIWTELSVTSVKNERGDIQFLLAFIQNISSKKIAEKSLRKSEADLRNILENTDTAYVLLDKKANVLSFNKVAQKMALNELGENINEGRDYLSLMPPGVREDVSEKILTVLMTGNEMKYERTYVQNDGITKWFLVSMHPILSEGNKILGLSIAATDITNRKKTEMQIKLSNERYTLVTKATRDVIWDWNISNNKIYRSANFRFIFGQKRNDLSTSWLDDIHPEDRERIYMSIYQKLEDPFSKQWEDHYRRCDSNGEVIYVQDRAYIVRDADKKPIRMVGAMTDVTTEKLLAFEREKITTDLLQRNRDLEQFSFTVSHNLRLPVANIMGLSSLIQTTSLSKEDMTKCIEGLYLSATKLDEVIKDLNMILQLKREINEKKETVMFSELLNNIKISIADLLKREDALIESNFEEVDRIVTLKSYMHSIFFNLISNSIKYRHGEAPQIQISSKKVGNKIILIFKDNGIGIDLAKDSGKIFGLYSKFHFHKEGKGIGLYMTKTQVEILGGTINVKSELNKGTEFRIEFKA